MTNVIEIPVKPYVKDWLTHPSVFGAEPLSVRKNSRMGRLIVGVLMQYPAPSRRLSPSEVQIGLSDDCPADGATLFDLDNRGKYSVLQVRTKFELQEEFITDTSLVRLGCVLEDMFELSMCFFVRGRMDRLPSELGAVKRFYELYEIDTEQYDYETAVKVSQRSRAYGLSSNK